MQFMHNLPAVIGTPFWTGTIPHFLGIWQKK